MKFFIWGNFYFSFLLFQLHLHTLPCPKTPTTKKKHKIAQDKILTTTYTVNFL